MKKRMKERIQKICCICMMVFYGVSLTGCSSKDSIEGAWIIADSGSNDFTMSFYDDGTCLNTPIRTNTSARPVSYKQQDDGMLIFTMEWDGSKTYERTENKEEALESSKYYYLSGDTLILCKEIYARK